MSLQGWVRVGLIGPLVLSVGLLTLHSRASAPRALDEPGGLLLGNEPEPDGGPIPPGTPRQPRPMLLRHADAVSGDPMAELRRLKRRAEQYSGPLLGPAPPDAARYRQLLDLLGPEAVVGPRPAGPARPQPGPQRGGFRIASRRGQWTDVVASPVAWGKLPLRAEQPVTLEARNVTGGRPLLYLIRDGLQVAYSGDPAEDGSLTLTYTPSEDGDFHFLVRGAGDGSVGSCDLYLDGLPLFQAVKFGGTAVAAEWAAGDEFQIAHLPAPEHRVVDTVLFAFDGRDRFVGRNDDGGVNGCSRLVMSPASTGEDAHVLVACSSQDPVAGGRVRLYANRLSEGDPDEDRLATPLEAGLGSDAEAPDSDGDGLRDDWEVLGLHTTEGDEDLPAYSDPWTPGPAAHPTRMDIFLEMDWMAGASGDPHQYRLTDAGLARVVEALRKHGDVWLHPDLGQMGARGSRGGQSFGYQPRFHFTRSEPRSMEDLWSGGDYFAASRRHVFVYAVSIDRFEPQQYTTGEMRRLYENGRVIGSAEVWNPRYSPGFVICNGTGIYNHPQRQAAIVMHELGHCLRLRHGGGVDTNGKPNYVSVMNYLYTLTSLSPEGDLDYSRGTVEPLDEEALDEAVGLGFAPSDHLYRVLRGTRRADVRTAENRSAIDWNGSWTLTTSPVAVDINGDRRLDLLTDFNDWQEVKRPTRGFGWVGLNAGIEEWTSYNDLP